MILVGGPLEELGFGGADVAENGKGGSHGLSLDHRLRGTFVSVLGKISDGVLRKVIPCRWQCRWVPPFWKAR